MDSRIRLEWPTGADFLARFDESSRTLRPLEPIAGPRGMRSLEIYFHDRKTEFHLHAEVRDGAIGFLDEERDRLELVLTCARGESLPYFKRRHPRYLCSLPARVTLADGVLEARAIDLSEGGVRLAVPEHRFRVDLTIRVALSFPRDLSLELRGRVASFCQSSLERAIGVEFLFESAAQRAKLKAAIQQLLSSR